MTSIRREIRRVVREGAPPFSCRVEVDSVTRVSDGFVRVRVRGEGLAAYREVLPADAFKVFLPPDGTGTVEFPARDSDGLPYWPEGARRPVLRPFTVRHFDADGLRLAFDVASHGGGLAIRWLGAVGAGDVVGLAGMRREFCPGTGVERHLLVGDASALPAVAAIVESLVSSVPATVYLAVDHESDRALLTSREHVTVHWVEGGSDALLPAIRRSERPGRRAVGRTQAWLAGEAGVVRELRRFALRELGVDREDLHAAAYWKSGLDSTGNDAVLLERYRRQVDAGGDVTDPDVREKVELEL